MIDEQTQGFIDAYRDALGRQRDTSLQAVENNRRNAFQNIMGSANAAGMMYSNFPERAKIQYDANTYMPTRSQIETSYQTGLDKLRSNIVNNVNQIAELKDEIASMNKQASGGKGTLAINDSGDYSFRDKSGGVQYRNSKGDPIRFGTAAQRAGKKEAGDIINYLSQTANEDTWNQFNTAWEAAKGLGYTGIAYNVGNDYQDYAYDFLDDGQAGVVNSLGLRFVK
jgi:hypothetical protein